MKSTYPLLFSISLDAVAFGMKRNDDVDSKESIKIDRQKCIRNVKLKFLSYFDFFIVWLFIFVCDIVLILVSLLLFAIVRFSATFILLFLAISFTSILIHIYAKCIFIWLLFHLFVNFLYIIVNFTHDNFA